jgi:hypothetical protein
MSNHIHVFIFLEFGMFGSVKGKKAEREKATGAARVG